MSVSKRVGEVLKESHLSGPKIAERLGVSFSTISNLKNGVSRSIGSDFLEAFFKEFPNISIEWIFTGEGSKEKSSDNEFLKKKGINKPLDPEVSELINNLYELNESLFKENEILHKQIQTQSKLLKKALINP